MINILNKLDQNLFLWMNGFHFRGLDQSMVFMSGQAVWIPMIAFFLWKGKTTLENRKLFLFVLFMFVTLVLSDVFSSYIIKNLFTRLRPCRVEELSPLIYQFGQKCGGKFGFVSSHAANSSALLLFSLRALNLKGKFHALWILPVLVGYSRIYLGVHYPGDVLGGMVIGSVLAMVTSECLKKT